VIFELTCRDALGGYIKLRGACWLITAGQGRDITPGARVSLPGRTLADLLLSFLALLSLSFPDSLARSYRATRVPRIYVHPTEGARTSFSWMRMALNGHCMRTYRAASPQDASESPPNSRRLTPGSSRSNSTSSLYRGPVHGAPFVPFLSVPSPPRSKTSDDLARKPPAAQIPRTQGLASSRRQY
jgi:hypothetical protein